MARMIPPYYSEEIKSSGKKQFGVVFPHIRFSMPDPEIASWQV
jgi:hypothetical protein